MNTEDVMYTFTKLYDCRIPKTVFVDLDILRYFVYFCIVYKH